MCDTIATKVIPNFKSNGFDGIIETSKNQIKNFFKIQEENRKLDISEADNNGSKTGTVTRPPQPDFTKEEERLKTFINWTNTHISPVRLVKAGFYFINRGDVVRCAFCKVEGHCWLPEDNPMDDHKSWMPHCPFVQQQQQQEEGGENNCNQHDNSETTNPQIGQDTFGGFEVFPNSLPEDEEAIEELQTLAVQWTRKSYNSEYRTEESRLSSFKKWPIGLKQKPELMARAGLYYLGVGDEVVCYYCGGGLRNWEGDDDPWEQHARWFPKCTYLLLHKGKEFVDAIQAKLEEEEKNGVTSKTLCSTAGKNETCSTSTNVQTKEETSTNATTTDKGLCKICYKNDICLMFKPCKHALACVECGLAVAKCPVCRSPITGVNRMFLL